MQPPPPKLTQTAPLCPSTPLFLSVLEMPAHRAAARIERDYRLTVIAEPLALVAAVMIGRGAAVRHEHQMMLGIGRHQRPGIRRAGSQRRAACDLVRRDRQSVG